MATFSAHQKRYIGYRTAKYFYRRFDDNQLLDHRLGFDLSLTSTGYVFEHDDDGGEYGTIGTKAKDGAMFERLGIMRQDFDPMVGRCGLICWERVSVGQNFQALKSLSMVLGTMYQSVNDTFDRHTPVLVRVSPQTIKKLAGMTGGKKNQILKEVYKNWGFDAENDDIADAFLALQFGRALAYVCEAFVEEMPSDTRTEAFSDALLDVYKKRHDTLDRTFEALVPDALNPEGVDVLNTVLGTLSGKSGLRLIKLNDREAYDDIRQDAKRAQKG